jgi:hypothetical protein
MAVHELRETQIREGRVDPVEEKATAFKRHSEGRDARLSASVAWHVGPLAASPKLQ